MITSLVGYTGFVGSNLASQHHFDYVYNSKNIKESYNTNPEILVYSGLRAEKFIANKFPEQSLSSVREAFENIKKIHPDTVILISSIDVYKNPIQVDEDAEIDTNGLPAYGMHRYMLEQWIKEAFDNYLIVRLPALFGKNLKKNFIYDYINIIPSQLNEVKFTELCRKDSLIKSYYHKEDTGYYKCKFISSNERKLLMNYFTSVGFSALNFTDSRAVFQYYNLSNIWKDISAALKNNIRCINMATEPIKTSDLYYFLNGTEFINELEIPVPHYDFRTKYAELFGGHNGYMQTSDSVMNEIKQFVLENKK